MTRTYSNFTPVMYHYVDNISVVPESALQTAIDYAPEVHRAYLVRQSDPSVSVEVAKRYACQRIQFKRNVTEEHIRQAHEIGLICNLFFSDDPQDAIEYVRKGIDVILTNCAHAMITAGFQGRQQP